MKDKDAAGEPDWELPLALTLTPAGLIHALFQTASTVHTGWESCVESTLVLSDLATMDEASGNYCRLVEQEYVEDDNKDLVWHDWLVEVRLGEVLIAGHWQLQTTALPLDWDWAARQAEMAFEKACTLFGKRVRRGLAVEGERIPPSPGHARHH